jgi:hypothetical protein
MVFSKFPVRPHRVNHHRVILTGIGQQGFQLRALGVFARCPIGEHLVELKVFELPIRVLVEAADPSK